MLVRHLIAVVVLATSAIACGTDDNRSAAHSRQDIETRAAVIANRVERDQTAENTEVARVDCNADADEDGVLTCRVFFDNGDLVPTCIYVGGSQLEERACSKPPSLLPATETGELEP